MNDKSGATTILIVIIFLAAAGTAGVFGWRARLQAQRRTYNEHSASSMLKSLATAEAEYRSMDLDGNGVPDFWTGDVAELVRRSLIYKGLGTADPHPLHPLSTEPVPFNGYLFAALEADHGQTPPEEYRQDTDGKSGKVHHRQRFGFVTYPAEPGLTGNYIFILNENNTQFRAHVRDTPVPKNWPSDDELKRSWSKPH